MSSAYQEDPIKKHQNRRRLEYVYAALQFKPFLSEGNKHHNKVVDPER